MTMQDQNFEAYVPVYDAIPEKWDEAKDFTVETFKKVSNAINVRTIGWMLEEELLSGQQFIPSAINTTGLQAPFRSVFRKVINFGPLGNGDKAVAHGITFDTNFTLVHMWASATDPTNLLAIPIPYVYGTKIIQLYMDSTNVHIVTQENLSNYSRCFVVIEYLLEP